MAAIIGDCWLLLRHCLDRSLAQAVVARSSQQLDRHGNRSSTAVLPTHSHRWYMGHSTPPWSSSTRHPQHLKYLQKQGSKLKSIAPSQALEVRAWAVAAGEDERREATNRRGAGS